MIKGLMLFQEDTQKELLEKNKRTEGPIFEGDESLLWARNKFTKEYEKILLARIVNQKWFLKNENSKKLLFHLLVTKKVFGVLTKYVSF